MHTLPFTPLPCLVPLPGAEASLPPAPAAAAHHGPQRTLWDRVREALTLDAIFEKLDAALDFEEGFDFTVSTIMEGVDCGLGLCCVMAGGRLPRHLGRGSAGTRQVLPSVVWSERVEALAGWGHACAQVN